MMNKIFVVDASGYLYRSYFAIRNMTNPKGESTNALFGFIRSILKLRKDFAPDYLVSVFDGPHNAKKRTAIYEHYKAHRQAMPPDLVYQIQWAQNFCKLMGIPFLSIPEVEADDVMGSIAVWAEHHGDEVFLCTSDKDMCQLVDDKIKILNTHKENLIIGRDEVLQIHGIKPEQFIDYLALTGDASDNIPGIEGFGPKTAAALIQEFGTLEEILQNPQKLKGKKQEQVITHAENARLSKRLATIDVHVPIPHNDDFYRIQEPDVVHLKEFYNSMHFHTLLKEFDLQQTAAPTQENVDYHLVDDEQAFRDLLSLLQQQKELCVDTETTQLQPLKAELVGIGLGFDSGKAWYIPVNGNLGLERVLQGLKPIFENPLIGFYGHNLKYDYQVLGNYGIFISNICFDTILASYLLNSQSRQHSLDALSLEYFGKVKIPTSDLIGKGKSAITMREVPIEKVCAYCCEDVDYTVRLKGVLEPLLKERKLTKLFKELELPLLKILAAMERTGIYLDVPLLQSLSTEVNRLLKIAESGIYELAGEEFNLNSPKQLGHILFEKLGIKPPKKAAGLSTSADILELLKADYPIAEKILEYRMLEKLRSTYIETLPNEVYPKTHRIHCTFLQSGTATGRLACQDPNLQNIPVRTEIGRRIREAFRPEKAGWSYLAADYSQIELRLVAHLSEDPALVEAFNRNEDIHAHTASSIYGIPISEVTKEQRYSAKAVNFGIIYGQGAFGLSEQLGIDRKEAAAFIETYFQRFPRVREYIEECKESARKTGKAVTITGRERALPEIHSKNAQLRAAAERLAINTPLQGTAADLIKMAMLKISDRLKKEQLHTQMILQIHDELIFELPDFEIISLEPLIRDAMQNVLKLKVPLIVDIQVGKNWKEC